MTGADTALASLRGLRKSYPGVQAIRHVDLDLRAGEITGLVGKNGAGKSTLIKVLAGLVRPDAGTIHIDGRPAQLGSPADAARHGLAFVHQELALVPHLSVAENVLLGLGYPARGRTLVHWPRVYREAAKVLARLDIAIDPRRPTHSLSIAEQRLVMLARALAAQARLIVLDEPTASLSSAEIEHLFRVVRALRGDGVGTVFVSHRLDEILDLTERVVVMRDGSVVGDFATAALDREKLITAISGPSAAARPARRLPRSADAGEEVLRVEHVSRPPVLTDVTLSIRAGEVVGLAGLAGAGRTELARIIFGVDRPGAGTVSVRGRAVRPGRLRQALRRGIVLLPEDRRHQGNVLDFGVRSNITLATLRKHRRTARLALPSRRSERVAARQMVERLNIGTASVEQAVRSLSGGNQQKVVLAKWLRHGAEVFLFDEPTHGVDVEGKQEIYAIMRELADEGRAVMFISSEFAELVEVCDRVVVLRDGRIAAELDAGLSESLILEHCFTTDPGDGGLK
ncbi:sugar ABC transporter ATP-binding protein [Actinomadura sp. GTD37]|uniref:sugar ABC transporter ATP-binding protein n=1 Tax=Actinomadura sp. GTD37 TaxID=1778030 RepID=UPI0035C0D83F